MTASEMAPPGIATFTGVPAVQCDLEIIDKPTFFPNAGDQMALVT